MRRLYLLLTILTLCSTAQAQVAPSPLPRICRAGDPAMTCIPSFVVLRSDPNIVLVAGAIWDDAPANFLRTLRLAPEARRLVLRSEGGYIDPALLLAKEVRRRGMATKIDAGGFCFSSCAYVFFAGTERIVRGELGVHQVYNGFASSVQSQQGFADVFSLVREFGVADGFITPMLATPPDEMHAFSRREIADLKISSAPRVLAPDPARSLIPQRQEDRLPSEGPSTTLGLQGPPPPGSHALLLEASEDGRTPPSRSKVLWSGRRALTKWARRPSWPTRTSRPAIWGCAYFRDELRRVAAHPHPHRGPVRGLGQLHWGLDSWVARRPTQDRGAG